jgi:hypothetical protein
MVLPFYQAEILFTYPTRLTLLAVPALAVTLRKTLPVPRTGSPATNKDNPDFAGIVTMILCESEKPPATR